MSRLAEGDALPDMGRTCGALALWAVVMAATPAGQALPPPVAAGWQAYVAAAEARIAAGRGQAVPRPPGVERGEIVVEEVKAPGPDGNLEVPDARVHHWRGTVLVPGARLETSCRGSSGNRPTPGRKTSCPRQSSRSGRAGSGGGPCPPVAHHLRGVRYRARGAFRAPRRKPRLELERGHEDRGSGRRGHAEGTIEAADEDRGFLWRWNAYWRYEQVADGILVECESVTLSRTIPLVLRPVAGPIVGHVARESMDRTLSVFRERFRKTQLPAGDRE